MHQEFSYTIPSDAFSDPENDTILVSPSLTPDDFSLQYFNNNATLHGFPDDNTKFGVYVATLRISDALHPNAITINLTFEVYQNLPPYNISTPTSVTTGTRVGFLWEYIFDKSQIVDGEGDTLTYSHSISPNISLISAVENSTHYVLSGTPTMNSQAQIYNLIIIVDDGHTDVDDYEFSSNFEILPNLPPTIQSMSDVALLAPDGYTWSYGATLTEDPESLNYTSVVLFDGSPTMPNWLTYDLSTYTFFIASSSNSFVGTYNITIEIQDDYNPKVDGSFMITIVHNSAPQHIKLISGFEVVTNYNFLHQFDPIDELFDDPENRPMVGDVMTANGNPLLPFLYYNQTDNTLSGFPRDSDIGDWDLMYVATDNHNHTSNTSFVLTVKT